jgi:hypothetical protein
MDLALEVGCSARLGLPGCKLRMGEVRVRLEVTGGRSG